ncbi:hypothetical protein CKAH01_05514 [Colletotrichum kahawae]|uniref:Uncharacterized protein n=1 Tax=Colletotrichum kahawae TaxID=34407 RepID=A0AAD9YG01_COLKA|nr:hypothetical protein CKAH01_05514 [Colletotrichum kahawae]
MDSAVTKESKTQNSLTASEKYTAERGGISPLTHLQSPKRSPQVPLIRLHKASGGGGVARWPEQPARLRVPKCHAAACDFWTWGKHNAALSPVSSLKPPDRSPIQGCAGSSRLSARGVACVDRKTSSATRIRGKMESEARSGSAVRLPSASCHPCRLLCLFCTPVSQAGQRHHQHHWATSCPSTLR